MGKLTKVLSSYNEETYKCSMYNGKLTMVLNIMGSKYNGGTYNGSKYNGETYECSKCNRETYKGFKHPLVHFYCSSTRD